jgi:hypothetical protein
MPSRGSVTGWIDRLKAGDPAAAQPLWECYFRRLVRLARRRLPPPVPGARSRLARRGPDAFLPAGKGTADGP